MTDKEKQLYEGKTDHDLLIMIHTTMQDMEKRMNRFDMRFWGLLCGIGGTFLSGLIGYFKLSK